MVRALAVLCIASVACGDDVGSSTDGGGGEGGGAMVVASGDVRRAMPGARFEDLGPVEGATVCVHERPDVACATSTATGAFELRFVPALSEVALAFVAAGYQSALVPVVTDERPLRLVLAMEPADAIAARNAAAGAAADPESGSIGFVAVEAAGVPDVSVTAVPAGDGPYYVGADHAVDPSLDATSERGFGFVLGLAPGITRLRFAHPTLACDMPLLGWPSTDGTVRAPVAAAHETAVAVLCGPM